MADADDRTPSRRQRILTAGTEVFPRYGYARTTFGDIAQAAQLSRPTVYAEFSDKQQIFEAVIDSLADAELARIRDDLDRLSGLQDRLRCACLSWVEPGYRMLEQSPDAKDLFDDRFAAVQRANERFEALLTEILAEAGSAGPDLTPARLSVMISCAMQGCKRRAADWADLQQMITTLLLTTCQAIQCSTQWLEA